MMMGPFQKRSIKMIHFLNGFDGPEENHHFFGDHGNMVIDFGRKMDGKMMI